MVKAAPTISHPPLYLAHGVTTVFNMRGEAEQLGWKRRIKDGTLLAPNLYTSGEFVNEPRINNIQEVEQEVAYQISEGYDIIKFHELYGFKDSLFTTVGLEKSAYLRLNQLAREANIPLIGHAPYRVGLNGLLEAGQSIAHMNELANLYFLPPLDLNRGMFIQLTKWSFAILLAGFLIWMIIRLLRQILGRRDKEEIRQLKKFRKGTFLMILVSAICCILWILVVPPGFFFGNIWLLILLSCFGLLALLMVVMLARQTGKIWINSNLSIYAKGMVTLFTLISIGLTVGLSHWILFAWHGSDMMINHVAQECKKSGIWVQSTLMCQEIAWNQKDGYRRDQIVQDPVYPYLPVPLQKSWREFVDYKVPGMYFFWKRHTEFLQKLTSALSQNGVPLMAGTDAMGLPLCVPGISLHKELQLLSECGLSSGEVLWTTMVGPAKFLGKENEFGTITVGKRADLLLIEGNPLEDLTHLLRLKGVMVRGIWLPKAKLDQMLENTLIKEAVQ